MPSGDHCAIGAELARDLFAARVDSRIERYVERCCERARRKLTYQRRADTQRAYAARPIELIAEHRAHHLRHAGARGGSCRARATVMNDGGNARKGRLLIDVVDRETTVCVVN